jgi:cytochrome b561
LVKWVLATSAPRPVASLRSAGRAVPSGPVGYNRAARAMHWLVAALAVMVVAFGWAGAAAARNTPARGSLLLLHGSIGLTILAIMLVRILWRWRHPAPALPPTLSRLEAALAHLTHLALYLIFIAMPLAGYANAAAQGQAVSLFGIISIPPLLPVDERLSQVAIAIHLSGQYLVYLLVAAHVAAALFHGIVRRDGVLERMLPRRRTA